MRQDTPEIRCDSSGMDAPGSTPGGSEDAVRFDLRAISKNIQITPQGFLKIPADFTRPGVFEYHREDGTIVRELRPESEVFAAESMASAAGAPVVLGHPPELWVTPDNARRLAVGWVAEKVDKKDAMVSGHVTVMDGRTIEGVGNGQIQAISMGYRARIDFTSGNDPKYGPYDQIQRGIRYNHCALGPRDPNWGRAGAKAKLRLDNVSEIAYFSEYDEPAGNDREEATMRTVKVNGIQFEVDEGVAQAIELEQARHDSVKSDLDKLQGKHDAQTEELNQTKAELAKANDPARFDSAVQDRIDLTAKARKVLGAEAEIKGSARDIHEAALRADNADLDLADRSDDYVSARFDALIERIADKAETEQRTDSSKTETRAAVHAAQTGGGDPAEPQTRVDANEARRKMIAGNQEAWQQPLSVSVDR